jgi:hypothetical protein
MLPEGVLGDDGVDRGIIFVCAGAHRDRQFEFVKTEWVNKGLFFGTPSAKNPLVGPNDGRNQCTIFRRAALGSPSTAPKIEAQNRAH